MASLQTMVFGSGAPLGVLHGFTQSAQVWEPFSPLFKDRRMIAVSAPGHGGSAGVRADLWEGADLVAEALNRQLGAQETSTDLVGYSMGGRLALHVAFGHPQLIRRLVLVSATAGIEDQAEREARRRSDQQIALRAENGTLREFVEWWLERPIFSTLSSEAADTESRLGGDVQGLASSLRLAGTGSQESLWPRLGVLSMPVLVIAGALDTAYLQRAERMVQAIGDNAALGVIDGAGHACHMERPHTWARMVEDFLSADPTE